MVKIFSKKIRELRKQLNLTQTELAKILNVSPSRISMYERGERTPNDEMLIILSKYFKVSIDELLMDDLELHTNNPKRFGIIPFNPNFDEIDEMTQEIFDKRKILFDKSAKATKEDLDKMIAMFDVMFGKDE